MPFQIDGRYVLFEIFKFNALVHLVGCSHRSLLSLLGFFFLDADGATDFGSGLQNLVTAMHKNMEGSKETVNKNISMFGSRAHLQEESTTQRSLIRTFLMRAFHFFVTLLVSSKIRDTQVCCSL